MKDKLCVTGETLRVIEPCSFNCTLLFNIQFNYHHRLPLRLGSSEGPSLNDDCFSSRSQSQSDDDSQQEQDSLDSWWIYKDDKRHMEKCEAIDEKEEEESEVDVPHYIGK